MIYLPRGCVHNRVGWGGVGLLRVVGRKNKSRLTVCKVVHKEHTEESVGEQLPDLWAATIHVITNGLHKLAQRQA